MDIEGKIVDLQQKAQDSTPDTKTQLDLDKLQLQDKSAVKVESPTIDAHFDYITHVHSYISECITFADAKAGFVFTICGALIAVLYGCGAIKIWVKNPNLWTIREVLALVSILCLGVSVACTIVVIAPRLNGSLRGLIYWKSILEYGSSTEFCDSFLRHSTTQLDTELLKHCFELANICKKKYEVLSFAVKCGALGLIVTVAYLTIY